MTALLIERPARPAAPVRLRMACPPPSVVGLLIERLVDRFVEGDADTADAVGDLVEALVPGCWTTFESLAAVAEQLIDLEAGTFDRDALPWDVDPDKVEGRARGDYAVLLDELRDMAMLALGGGR